MEKEQRRRKGEGTVRRRVDGRWEGRLQIAEGRVKYVYGATEQQVQDALAYARREQTGERIMLDLGEERYKKVRAEAERRGVSMERVVLEAVDRLPPPLDVRRAAIERILAAEPMPLPDDPADLRRELDEAHDRVRW